MSRTYFRAILFLTLGCFCVGCSEDSDEIRSACGAVLGDSLTNPVGQDDLIFVEVRGATDGSLVSVQEPNGGDAYLILLQGVRRQKDASMAAAANAFLSTFSSEAYLAVADFDCTTNDPEFNELLNGQLFTESELSFSEELLRRGLGQIAVSTDCNGDLITNCLAGVAVGG